MTVKRILGAVAWLVASLLGFVGQAAQALSLRNAGAPAVEKEWEQTEAEYDRNTDRDFGYRITHSD
jgi:hypothetical protein